MKSNPSGRESVLLPINDSGSSISCVRSLGRQGVRTVAVSEHRDRPAFASRYCNEKIIIPSPYDDLIAYKDALLTVAKRPHVRTIVPHREMDSYVLAKYESEFEGHVETLWPSLEQVTKVQDRLRLAEVARDAGVPIPETWSFDEVDKWDRDLIIKPRYSFLTGEYVDSLSERDCEGKMEPVYVSPGVEPDLEAIQDEMHKPGVHIPDHIPIVQERISGTEHEYGFRGLCENGTTVMTCQKRQIRAKSYVGGASAFRETMADPAIDELGRRILEHLDWHGLASVQFLWNETTDEYVFTEINPRVWASIEMDVLSGADFPYGHWLVATGRSDRIEPGYEIGIGNHLLIGELQYLTSVLRERYPSVERPSFRRALREVLSSCIEQPNFDYVHLDDPGPFVRGVRNQFVGGRGTGQTAGQ